MTKTFENHFLCYLQSYVKINIFQKKLLKTTSLFNFIRTTDWETPLINVDTSLTGCKFPASYTET